MADFFRSYISTYPVPAGNQEPRPGLENKFDALRKGKLGTVINSVGLATHVGLPRVGTGLASPARFLLSTEGSTDLRTGRTDVDVGDTAVGTFGGQEALRRLDGVGEDRRRQALGDPVVDGDGLAEFIELDDVGIATSGDYRNYFEQAGRRYSHTIDPTTGRPVTHGLASVTVADPSTMRADALATALMVLGPEAGYRFAEEHELAAFFIIKGEDGFYERETPAFRRYLASERE